MTKSEDLVNGLNDALSAFWSEYKVWVWKKKWHLAHLLDVNYWISKRMQRKWLLF